MSARVNRILGHMAPSPLLSRMDANPTAAGKPLNVVVTGAAGNIAYAILFMIGRGNMTAPGQKINLRLLDIPAAANALKGVEMEIRDGAFSVLNSIMCTTDYKEAFSDIDVALLIGARPRSKGMERADLLKANAAIFVGQGKALNDYANPNVKVLVVGNPANTNALICMTNAPKIPRKNFTAMTRLDQNRSEGLVALKSGIADAKDVKKLCVWGNHSATMYADVNHGTACGKPIKSVVNDDEWLKGEFVKTVQQRGKAIIEARGKSSAASAANAAVDHMRDWLCGTPEGTWSSMGVCSDGNSYGIPADLIFSFPCVCKNGEWKIVDGLPMDAYSKQKVKATMEELMGEKADALS